MHRNPHSAFPSGLVQWLAGQLPRPAGSMVIMGISGLQGSGKSTLAAQVVTAVRQDGLQAATLSLDDVYLTAAQRRQLARQVHPLLATRGPPGTHDLPLLERVLCDLSAGRPTALPRFDKLADDRLPETAWPRVDTPLDLLVIEGWMLGALAQDAAALRTPVNRLEVQEDPDGRWRHWCNAQLDQHYPAVWKRLDMLAFLEPPCWDVILRWRGEQEASLALKQGRKGMEPGELARFVGHFERTSRQILADLPGRADVRIRLGPQREVVGCHRQCLR